MASKFKPVRLILLAVFAFFCWSTVRPAACLAADKAQQSPQHVPAPEKRFAPLPAGFSPIVPLTEYQKRWIEDKSRLKIGMMTRQGGKSFGTSLEAVVDCYMHPRTTWVFLSAGERQSKELMNKAAMHARAMNQAIMELTEQFKDEHDNRTEYKQLEILFPNGSRIIGLPANPATARGHSAHILLDEFALHKDSRAIWTALFPSITRGYKIRIISTPLGKKNKFYELWTGRTHQIWDGQDYKFVGERGGYSKHKVTIFDAVEMGLNLYDDEGEPCEPEDLRLGLADDEAWHQEFLCEFVDEQTAFLTYDLIEGCEDCTLDHMPPWAEKLVAAAIAHHDKYKSEENPPPFEAWNILRDVLWVGELYAGFDVARVRDLSVIWLDEEVNGVGRARAVISMKNLPFTVQKYVLWSLIKLPQMRRVCIDQSGLGRNLAEDSIKVWPSKVEGVDFSNAHKEALATGLKKALEDKKEALPPDTTIRQSLHAIKKIATSAGNFRYDADRDEKIGHADHFWAKALAVQARGGYSGPVWGASRGARTSQNLLRGYHAA